MLVIIKSTFLLSKPVVNGHLQLNSHYHKVIQILSSQFDTPDP